MASIKALIEMETEQGFPAVCPVNCKKHSCNFCDCHATAFWQTSNSVMVCSMCAVDILPKLIADATLTGLNFQDKMAYARAAEQTLESIAKNFYRASFSFALRKLSEMKKGSH